MTDSQGDAFEEAAVTIDEHDGSNQTTSGAATESTANNLELLKPAIEGPRELAVSVTTMRRTMRPPVHPRMRSSAAIEHKASPAPGPIKAVSLPGAGDDFRIGVRPLPAIPSASPASTSMIQPFPDSDLIDELHATNARLETMRDEADERQRTLHDYENRMLLLGQDYERQLFDLKRRHASERKQAISAHEIEIAQLQDRHTELEEKTRLLQERVLHTIDSAQWAPTSSNDAGRQISVIRDKIKNWAMKYALVPLNQVLAVDIRNELGARLHERGCIESASAWPMILRTSKLMARPDKASIFITSALLISQIFNSVFGDPLFSFEEALAKPERPASREGWRPPVPKRLSRDMAAPEQRPRYVGLRHDHGVAIDRLYKLIARSNENGARAWRQQLLRLLDPVGGAADAAVYDMKVQVTSGQSAAADILAQDAMKSVQVFIPGSTSRDAVYDLSSICYEAAALAWTVWQQRLQIQVLRYPELVRDTHAAVTLRFDASIPILEPDARHSALLQEDPNAMNGRNVWLVCQPAIVSNEGYDADGVLVKPSILARAVVWMAT